MDNKTKLVSNPSSLNFNNKVLLLLGLLLAILKSNRLNSSRQLNFSRLSSLRPLNNPSLDQCSNPSNSNNNPCSSPNSSNQSSNPSSSKQCLGQLLPPHSLSKQCLDRKLNLPSRRHPLLVLVSRDLLYLHLVCSHRISSSRQHLVSGQVSLFPSPNQYKTSLISSLEQVDSVLQPSFNCQLQHLRANSNKYLTILDKRRKFSLKISFPSTSPSRTTSLLLSLRLSKLINSSSTLKHSA